MVDRYESIVDFSDDMLRAYAVFGIDPLDRVDEFGFRFPKLSVAFLREKAEKQLRDALGRWREMRGRIDVPSEPVERARMAPRLDPEVFWWAQGIDPERLRLLRESEDVMDRYSMDLPDDEQLALLRRAKEIRASLPLRGGPNSLDKIQDILPEDESDMQRFVQYVEAYQQRELARMIHLGSAAHRLPTDDPFDLAGTTDRWEGVLSRYEQGTSGFGVGPLMPGTPMQRLRVLQDVGERGGARAMGEARKYLRKVYEQRIAHDAQDAWSRKYRAVTMGTHRALTDAGFNDPPQTVAFEEFNAFPGYQIPDWPSGEPVGTIGTVLWRGKSGTSIPADQVAYELQTNPPDRHYVGNGMYGDGLYFGDKRTAAVYAGMGGIDDDQRDFIENEVNNGRQVLLPYGSVIKAKLREGVEVVSESELLSRSRKFMEKIQAEVSDPLERKRIFEQYGLSPSGTIADYTRFAAATGIDASVNILGSNIVVFNRGALIVPKIDFSYQPRDVPPMPDLPYTDEELIPPPGVPSFFERRYR